MLHNVTVKAFIYLEQSRRDDLESIGYLMVYFLKGSLPWQGMKIAANEDRYKMIYKKKKYTKPEELAGAYHINLVNYIDYCRKLGFDEEPKYDHLINLLVNAMDLNQLKVDFDFDWSKDKTYLSHSSKINDSNLDNSINLSNIKNKNSNSNYSSMINKNDISQDLKMIMVEDNNSIKEYKEKEKMNNNKNITVKTNIVKDNESPLKYNTANSKIIDINKSNLNSNNNYKTANENSQKIVKEESNKINKEQKESERIANKDTTKDTNKDPKEEDNSLCTVV